MAIWNKKKTFALHVRSSLHLTSRLLRQRSVAHSFRDKFERKRHNSIESCLGYYPPRNKPLFSPRFEKSVNIFHCPSNLLYAHYFLQTKMLSSEGNLRGLKDCVFFNQRLINDSISPGKILFPFPVLFALPLIVFLQSSLRQYCLGSHRI